MVDFNYYLTQQIHPVVSHICASIQGTCPARLADCLGLDSSKARIDSHKVLYTRHADQRNATFQRVLQTGSELNCTFKWNMFTAKNAVNYGRKSKASICSCSGTCVGCNAAAWNFSFVI